MLDDYDEQNLLDKRFPLCYTYLALEVHHNIAE